MAINTRPDQYLIGKGRFYFAPILASGAYDAFRFIGNCPAFTISPKQDTLTHTSSQGGLNVQDRNIVVSQTLDIAFTTDNISAENQALWLGASLDAQTVTSQTGLTQTGTIKKGYVYRFGASAANPTGFKDVTVTSVTQGGNTLTAGTDYVVNGRAGQISYPTTGAAQDGVSATITYSVAAATKTQTNTRNLVINGAVQFISDNPDTGTGKIDYEYFLPFVRLAASGDVALIGTDWISLQFDGAVLQQYDAVGNAIPQITITPLSSVSPS